MPEPHDLTGPLLVALRQIMRAGDLHSRVLVQRYQLTAPQLLVLQQLQHVGPTTPGKLAKATSLSQATITGIITRLEKRNLVSRIRSDTDRRCIQVHLSRNAERILQQAPPPLPEQFIRQFDQLQDWERTQMLAVVQRMAAMMSQPGQTMRQPTPTPDCMLET